MSRFKRIAGVLMISAALLNLAPRAGAAEAEPAQHCFIIDHPVVCLVVCTVQNTSIKPCVQVSCGGDPRVCDLLGDVWQIIP